LRLADKRTVDRKNGRARTIHGPSVAAGKGLIAAALAGRKAIGVIRAADPVYGMASGTGGIEAAGSVELFQAADMILAQPELFEGKVCLFHH